MSFAQNPDLLAESALQALRNEDPRAARELMEQALALAPHRADYRNALGVIHLHLGEPEKGRPHIEAAIEIALVEREVPERRIAAGQMLEGFLLGLGAACEDLDLPADAEAAYRRLLDLAPEQPRAQNSLAHLLLAWGRLPEGLAALRSYVDADRDEPNFLEAAVQVLDALTKARTLGLHPRQFLDAHRGAYVEFFDHHARETAADGWIAEAARMRRDERGQVVPLIPDGARPYAAVRVDLVDPATAQVGQVGDQPMIVALSGFEPLARLPVLLPWPDVELPLWVSSQAPWDQLPVQVLFREAGGLDELDALLGDWYTRGWNGAFGTREEGRFHYVSDPEPRRGGRGAVYNLDLGRARAESVDALIDALAGLHRRRPLERVVLGRGFLP